MDGTINGRISWVPDGRSIIVVSDRGGKAELHARRLDDGGIRPLPRYDPRAMFGSAWSRDGKWLALRTDDQAAGKADILAVRPGVDSVATPVVASPEFSEYAPAISPDSRWLAYVTNAGGSWDVWVTSFPSGKGRWQVTTNGRGSAPLWSPDGRELFFVSGTQIMSATISQGNEFNVLSQQPLFSTLPYRQSGIFFRTWDVSRDGKRFLMLEQSTEAVVRIVAVMNWRAELKR